AHNAPPSGGGPHRRWGSPPPASEASGGEGLGVGGAACSERLACAHSTAGPVRGLRLLPLTPRQPRVRYDGRSCESFQPRNPRVREKELRIALVCFGGVSLAVYMH